MPVTNIPPSFSTSPGPLSSLSEEQKICAIRKKRMESLSGGLEFLVQIPCGHFFGHRRIDLWVIGFSIGDNGWGVRDEVAERKKRFEGKYSCPQCRARFSRSHLRLVASLLE